MSKVEQILKRLEGAYPEAHCELRFDSVFELLIAVILSAQCTDKRVNMVTKALFERFKTPIDYVNCSTEELEKAIFSCGFYRNKAKSIKKMCQSLLDRFDGKVPERVEDLESLSGVGKKTAAVVYAVGFGGQAIAVDTHVFRVSRRLGIAQGNTPLKVQDELTQLINENDLSHAHHVLLFHGRYTCHSRKASCSECVVRDLCDYFEGGGELSMSKQRVKMPVLDREQAIASFDEVNVGYTPEQAVQEAKRCLNCRRPSCVQQCPIGNRIPEFILKISEQKFGEAHQILLSKHDYASICGRVCPQERLCEGGCVKGRNGEPIAIGALERFVGDLFLQQQDEFLMPESINKRVAVVGSGPSGLAAAAQLIRAGVEVQIYEAEASAGGLLTHGIPQYRLPCAVAMAHIERVQSMGARFEFNSALGKDFTLEGLRSSYDAVYLACGLGAPQRLGIEGEELGGVLSAQSFLRGKECGNNVLVFGGGNVAMDAARTALRRGAKKCTIVYRRTQSDMPATRAEASEALHEGVKIIELARPLKFLGKERIGGALCMQLEQHGERGRLNDIEGSQFEIACDMALVAIGNSANDFGAMGLNRGKNGLIEVNEDLSTNIEGVFAGGDAVLGASTVVNAERHGQLAAEAILNFLKSR